jgi:tetratricopeptide (TPR) repeat protein
MKRLLFLFFFGIFNSAAALADQVANAMELAALPTFCRGTQLIRNISHDPVPIESYVKRFGEGYRHLHHYCWALNAENKTYNMLDKELKKSKLTYALGDIDYVLARVQPTFVFLPEIYTGKARILFKLDRAAEAVEALNKALRLRPDYSPASLQLSSYFEKKGDKTMAINVLKQGIDNSKQPKQAAPLYKRLKKLGVTYQKEPDKASSK